MTVFAKADEVSELLNCGKSTAYKIMRQLNNELKEKRLYDYLWKRQQSLFVRKNGYQGRKRGVRRWQIKRR